MAPWQCQACCAPLGAGNFFHRFLIHQPALWIHIMWECFAATLVMLPHLTSNQDVGRHRYHALSGELWPFGFESLSTRIPDVVQDRCAFARFVSASPGSHALAATFGYCPGDRWINVNRLSVDDRGRSVTTRERSCSSKNTHRSLLQSLDEL